MPVECGLVRLILVKNQSLFCMIGRKIWPFRGQSYVF